MKTFGSRERTDERRAQAAALAHRRARRSGARALRRLVAAGLFLFASATFVCAQASLPTQSRVSSLEEYHERVERAAATLSDLADVLDDAAAQGERGLTIDVSPVRAEMLDDVRAALPPSEKVARASGGGPPLEIDNRWLHNALSKFESEAERAPSSWTPAPTSRNDALRQLAERLMALDERVYEFEEASKTAGARDKDAEKGRLANILSDPDYKEHRAEETALDRLFRKIGEWLGELLPAPKPLRPGESGGASLLAQAFIYGLIALLVALVVRRYWKRRPTKKAARSGARVILGETIAEDQTARDLLSDAELLAQKGNLRGAIRKAYIALLCELGDRRVLSLAGHKTNRDYSQAVRDFAPNLHALFQPLTQSFERHWYGLAPATEEDWRNFRATCGRAINTE